MDANSIMQEVAQLKEEIIENRRFLHSHPGTGFDIQETVDYVKKELEEMGYEPVLCGKAGIIALAGKK